MIIIFIEHQENNFSNSKSSINMQKKPRISIITAAYNVEDYIKDCLDSILDQAFSDYELILIDDGSTDTTGQICDAYAAKNNRISVFHQSNGGVSDAWNKGIKLARGEYVGFVDSDDIIHPQMYELLYKAITETDSDIAYCNYQKFAGDSSNVEFDKCHDSVYCISSRECELEKLAKTNSGISEAIWKGIYRYECIKDIKFVSGKTWQDYMWSPCVILNAKKIVRVDRILYFWRQRPGSNSHGNKLKHYCNGLYVGCQLLEYLRHHYPDWFTLYTLRTYSHALNVYAWLAEAGDDDECTECEEIINTVRQYFAQVSVMDILMEPRTNFTRKLSALLGKISFPLASKVKIQIINYLNGRSYNA